VVADHTITNRELAEELEVIEHLVLDHLLYKELL
jgi:hypothetical protein